MRLKRTHKCGEISREQLEKSVTVCGWADNWRDHGGLLFVDVRDRYGKVQVVFFAGECGNIPAGQKNSFRVCPGSFRHRSPKTGRSGE